ncbi:hypothetical protein IKF84_03330 [Candidatus Saccharibacteria bacterium]|nr:hypothetical protein [Candidatus Saccharibacteria bacterium]
MSKRFVKVLLFMCMTVAGTFVMARACFAAPGSKFRQGSLTADTGNAKCLAESGGRSSFGAVIYACGVASCKDAVDKAHCEASPPGQQGCALWLGTITNSRSTTIYVEQSTGTVKVAFWGMCTDRNDETSKIEVTNDGDAISDTMNLYRVGWNQPRSIETDLDIDKFKAVATETVISDCETKYSKIVNVKRWHGDGHTSNAMDQEVVLIIRQNAEECTPVTPPPVTDLCDSWAPQDYLNSGDRKGTTSIDIRIKNTTLAGRKADSPYADWEKEKTDRLIYAMPTDKIEWHTCYFPGVQSTADTEVSSVNGRPAYYIDGSWGNYNELRDDVCQAESVAYQPLKSAPALAHPWANAYALSQPDNVTGRAEWGDLVGWDGGAAAFGDTSIHSSDSGRNTVEGDAGNIYGEHASTGPSSNPNAPIVAKIVPHNPTCEVWNDTCGECSCTSGESGCTCDSEGKNCKKACWGQCACESSYSSQLEDAEVTYGPDIGQDKVAIPYNFSNSTEVILNGDKVFSGETITVNAVTVKVGEKPNDETSSSGYATEVPDAEVALFGYVSELSDGGGQPNDSSSPPSCSTSIFPNIINDDERQCAEFQGRKTIPGGLNRNGILHPGDSEIEYLDGSDGNPDFTGTYGAFDAAAGNYICFVSAVWPATSGADDNWEDTSGNNQWRYSEPACRVIAKKPSFQVWGSDMYSNSIINNIPAQKRNVYNGYANKGDAFSKEGGTWTNYSSWVEEGLVLGGNATTENLASGAGTGKTNNDSKANAGNDRDFCNYGVGLTFSNTGGAGGCASGLGTALVDSDTLDREELIDYWTGGGSISGASNNVGDDVDLSAVADKGVSISSATGATIRYIEPAGNLSIHGDIGRSTTVLIKSNGDDEDTGTVTVTGNIRYNNNYFSGDTLKEIPKLIIFAKNVDIQCGVDEVDAIIITKKGGKVRTCSDADPFDGSGADPSDIDDSKRSRQLKIFGVVIADEIELGRTYGSAAWKGEKCSSVNNDLDKDKYDPRCNGQLAAAEVFDFDTSLLLWSEFMAGSSETDTLQQVYQVEIAPRY